MKRFLWLRCVVGMGCLVTVLAVAQDQSSSAAALAKRDYDEERYKSLEADVRALQSSNEALQKRLADLGDDLRGVREELAKKPSDAVTHDELNAFEKKLREVNDKREADTRLILDKLEKLAKAPPQPLPLPEPTPLPETNAPAKPVKGYEYEIKPGDYLSAIVEAYRKEGIKVTLDQVLKANPGLNPQKLKVGKKIIIPDPSQP
jgi:LysM repeat protein